MAVMAGHVFPQVKQQIRIDPAGVEPVKNRSTTFVRSRARRPPHPVRPRRHTRRRLARLRRRHVGADQLPPLTPAPGRRRATPFRGEVPETDAAQIRRYTCDRGRRGVLARALSLAKVPFSESKDATALRRSGLMHDD